ncbi:hypothetical protein SEA_VALENTINIPUFF_81 [Microbacterium phage ValentiniPuff]|uniref:Uncharacterized protein n=1 Tax=Microbacterium phage ValentiniPuff TaxID=2315705 RepID=A0A386KPL1_9CAUD|nr:hypothetical protein SEA_VALENTINIPUFF_81 [Microbacterium phage ValentiniPuff]
MGEPQHSRDAAKKLETAEIDVARTDAVLERFHTSLNKQETIYRRNGFGEAMTLIMRQPARGGA